MNIRLFNRTYWLRRFEEQRNVKGYLVSDYKDEQIDIHVHPAGSESVSTQSEGTRKYSRLEGHGEVKLTAADQELNLKGDLIRYDGHWYECRGCVKYSQTLLSHYNYEFVQVPIDASNSVDLDNPPDIVKEDSDETE